MMLSHDKRQSRLSDILHAWTQLCIKILFLQFNHETFLLIYECHLHILICICKTYVDDYDDNDNDDDNDNNYDDHYHHQTQNLLQSVRRASLKMAMSMQI